MLDIFTRIKLVTCVLACARAITYIKWIIKFSLVAIGTAVVKIINGLSLLCDFARPCH